MDHHEDEHHLRPPHTLREMLGGPALVTGLVALGLWLVAAGYCVVVVVTSALEGNRAAVNFAIVELGAALVILAALGMFATLLVVLVTHTVRVFRPKDPAEKM